MPAYFPLGHNAYVVTGVINAVLMAICFWGAWVQLRKIWQRRSDSSLGEAPTELLSTRQFTSSFLGTYAFFVFGYSYPVIDHFLVWPRLAAALIFLAIVWEIHRDRRSRATRGLTRTLSALLVAGLLGWSVRLELGAVIHQFSTALLLLVAGLIAYGYSHQIRLIWHSGRTGALSLRMNQFILAMDLSTLAFALAIGIRSAWALALVATVSALTKLSVLWLFRWVKTSPAASARRATAATAAMA